MKSDLEVAVERLSIKQSALPGSVSKWTTLEKMALFDLATNVVDAFYREQVKGVE